MTLCTVHPIVDYRKSDASLSVVKSCVLGLPGNVDQKLAIASVACQDGRDRSTSVHYGIPDLRCSTSSPDLFLRSGLIQSRRDEKPPQWTPARSPAGASRIRSSMHGRTTFQQARWYDSRTQRSTASIREMKPNQSRLPRHASNTTTSRSGSSSINQKRRDNRFSPTDWLRWKSWIKTVDVITPETHLPPGSQSNVTVQIKSARFFSMGSMRHLTT